MSIRLQLDGVTEWQRELATLTPDLAEGAAAQQRTIAEQAAEEIRGRLPVVTGRLRASVIVQREPGRTPGRVFTRIAVTAPYAEHVEFGTSRVAPRPVFVPVTRRARDTFVKAVIDEVRQTGLKVTGQ